ncbi:MAG TPA: hypothetical protein VGO85_03795 [Caldimonas sp.]|jgi:hypothetical protein|nr:hypothetical protein [Caldimonas sp.]
MAPSSLRWRESWRVLAYAAALALAFIALERLELALFAEFGSAAVLERIGATSAPDDERLAGEAAQLAARVSANGATLPAGHRLATFRLGYEIGYASELIGSFAMSDAPVRAQAAPIGAAHVAVAQAQARALGLGDVAALPMRNAKDFFAIVDRVEADENGLGTRIEARLSPVHRHLYLLGAHAGAEAARVEGSGGRLALAPASLIRRHATLAGIAPALWQPLAAEARGETPAQVLARYRAALDALGADLGLRDASDARTLPVSAADAPR